MIAAGAPFGAVLFQIRAVQGSLDAALDSLVEEELRSALSAGGADEAARRTTELWRVRTGSPVEAPAFTNQRNDQETP